MVSRVSARDHVTGRMTSQTAWTDEGPPEPVVAQDVNAGSASSNVASAVALLEDFIGDFQVVDAGMEVAVLGAGKEDAAGKEDRNGGPDKESFKSGEPVHVGASFLLASRMCSRAAR